MDSPPSFDALIIDEAQDLITGPAKDVFDVLLRGGWEGRDLAAVPGPAQDVFGASNRDVVDSLSAYGLRFRLTTNCRNTSQIARDTAIAAGRTPAETMPIDGRQPVWLRYADEKEQRKSPRSNSARGSRRYPPDQIAILSPRRRENSVFSDGLPPGCRRG